MAACINRAPEGTFGAAVAETGVHDLLKVRTSESFDCIRQLPSSLRSSTNSR